MCVRTEIVHKLDIFEVTSIRAPQNNNYPDGVLVYKWNSIVGIHDESIRCFDGNQTRFNIEITSSM